MYPCVVVASSCDTCESLSPDGIVKGILETEELPEPLLVLQEVRSYPWHIITKYYEADVHVCCLDRKTIGNQAFTDSVNALVLPFDSLSINGLTETDQWLAFTNEFDAEVKILVCDHCAPDETDGILSGITRLQAQTWCIDKGFELVELNPIPEEEEESDLEDDFPETTGIKRVIQALHAHMWPNLVLKERSNRIIPVNGLQNALNGIDNRVIDQNNGEIGRIPCNKQTGVSIISNNDSGRKKLIAEVKPLPKETPSIPLSNVAIVSPTVMSAASVPIINVNSSESPPQSSGSREAITSAPRPSPTRDDRIDAMLEAVDAMPEDSFEELFQNLNAMKSKAESLSPSQRKTYAEQMAVAFWKSIGGNESEVDGLSSEDD